MALPFIPSDAGLLALQAGCVFAPRLAPGVQRLDRFHGRGWAAVPLVSIVGVIFLIRYASNSATWLTYLALVAVPLLAAAALAWASRGARWWLAVLVVPLFLLVWRAQGSLAGEAAGSILDALSCVTLGVLLAAVAPSGWLKVGIVAMSAADVWLVASDLLQHPNSQLVAASPGSGLPSLQSESFGSVSLGYGDLFVAGVLGALLSANRALQWRTALLTLALAAAFDLLFFFVNELPATVPVAVALIVIETWAWWQRRSRGNASVEEAAGGVSAFRRRSTPAGVTPRRAT
jgi:hypothetical protein